MAAARGRADRRGLRLGRRPRFRLNDAIVVVVQLVVHLQAAVDGVQERLLAFGVLHGRLAGLDTHLIVVTCRRYQENLSVWAPSLESLFSKL